MSPHRIEVDVDGDTSSDATVFHLDLTLTVRRPFHGRRTAIAIPREFI